MDFSGFTPDSFEQLINSLSIKVFGSGTLIYGNGPDGGREATFDGKVNYPNQTSDAWDGYGVIQAKFKERTENRDAEFKWAKAQLTKELKAWVESDKRNPKPDYFIFCVNVELTSASGGGKDKLSKLIDSYKTKLNLKDYAIWDLDKLKSLIDCHQEIRQRFLAFFTTGDLLSEIALLLKFNSTTSSTLLSYIRDEFRNEQVAKTSQGGDRTEAQINIADVFMDLPSSTNPSTQNNSIDKDLNSIPSLLRSSACKLDPLSLEQSNTHNLNDYCAQYVFIGGPGSGKSTIGQFLSQINRAAILDRIPKHQLQSNVIAEINNIKASCQASGFKWPNTPRYPFRIDLNQFAKELSSNTSSLKVDSLSKYLRSKISSNEVVTHKQLLDWFSEFPSILIFDGLDEVPLSSNREQVINQIHSFLGEIRQNESDVLIIASSRPDGYRDEFSGMGVIHRYLLPLDKQQALQCSEKYLANKYKDSANPKFIGDMNILEKSVSNPLIEKLMQSPLQVTFMVTVVSAFGKPSESRWKLFNDYYSTIYIRELQKSVPPFGKILEERKQDIDELHHNIGFILQYRAEFSGETTAEMKMSEFEHLVQIALEENGLEGAELAQEKTELVGAAKERLVFLTSKKENWISFDVRSLQEYMAAMAITNADSSDILERLKMIGASSYWRNTLLFAIGRFFSDPIYRKQRDNIRILCDDLNREGKKEHQFIKVGSILALEILESGTLGNTPAFIKNLSEIALELLDIPPSKNDFPKRLATIFSGAQRSEFEKALQIRLGQKEITKSLSSWLLIGYLRECSIDWATELITICWPDSKEDIILISELLSSKSLASIDEQNHLFETYLSMSVEAIFSDNFSFEPSFSGDLAIFPKLLDGVSKSLAFADRTRGLNETLMTPNGLGIGINTSKTELEAIINRIKNIDHDSSWGVLIKIYEFVINIDEKSLIDAVSSIQSNKAALSTNILIRVAPWVLHLVLEKNIANDELQNYVDSGNIGNLKLWEDAELRLSKETSSLEELLSFTLAGSKFDLLPALHNCSCGLQDDFVATNELLDKIKNITVKQKQYILPSILFHISCHSNVINQLDINKLLNICVDNTDFFYLHSIPILSSMEGLTDEKIKGWISLYDNLINSITTHYCHHSNIHNKESNFIIELYRDYPQNISLLRLAAVLSASGLICSINFQFILDRAKSSDEGEKVYFLIFELLSSLDSSILANKMASLMKSFSKNDKNFLLSFFVNNIKVFNEKETFEYLLRTFILNLLDDDWRIKVVAQELYIDFIQSLKSDFSEKNLISLCLPQLPITG